MSRPKSGTNELDQALFTATHFGFLPIRAPKITEVDLELVKHCGSYPHYDAAEKASLIRHFIEENLSSISYPISVAYKKPASRKKFGSYSLHVIGSPSGIAEATLIRAALSILSEGGYKNLRVDLNCVGDKESLSAYERELINFIRKFGTGLPEEARIILKSDIFNLFRVETEEFKALRENAPQAMSFLSTPSRIYFKEVLEYIDALGINFRLTPELIGEKNHVSHAIFSIRDAGDLNTGTESVQATPVLALGYRYSRLSRACGLRKDTPLAGVNIFSVTENVEMVRNIPKPKFCLLQLGKDAKIKTLNLLEVLRVHRITVHHFLSRDKFGAQLANAEALPVSHLIIIGQKEALDNTATVRNVITRAQDTISLLDLPRYLKTIRL